MGSENDGEGAQLAIIAVFIVLIGFGAVYAGLSMSGQVPPLPWADILIVAGVLFVVFLFLKYAIRAGVKSAIPTQRREPEAANEQPGMFHVVGVDKQTRMDVSANYRASSAANAKVKAELDGVIVTSVERI